MFASLIEQAGGINTWKHSRTFGSVDNQPIIRMNRDTLYSSAIVDISNGATLTIPENNGRYVSVMCVNQDQYINRIMHDAGTYSLTVDEFDTPYLLIAARVFVDPSSQADLAIIAGIQDGFAIHANSAKPFNLPDYDSESHTSTRDALLELARGVPGFVGTFGNKETVDPIAHLIGTAAGWGGLPESEAIYLNFDPGWPVGEYKLTVGDVPVDAFWSVTVYNAEGYFEANEPDAYNLNSVTSTPNDDGSITIYFGTCADDKPNCLPIVDGWNYLVRLYRPRREILDGTFEFPQAEPVQ